jgi:hypothetical protein
MRHAYTPITVLRPADYKSAVQQAPSLRYQDSTLLAGRNSAVRAQAGLILPLSPSL